MFVTKLNTAADDIATLQSKVNDPEKGIDALNDSVASINKKLNQIKGEIHSIIETLENLVTSVTVNATANSIISNSNRPLYLSVTLGFFMSLLSFLMAVYNIFAKFAGLNEVAGYTSTIFSIWFVGGLLLFMMGILGLYIGKIFDQVKGRPVFIVSETLNLEEK